MRPARWLIAVPAFSFALLAPTWAQSQPLECRQTATDALYGPIYECRTDWLPTGSRITAEQRLTVNAVIATTMILGRRKQ
jgi:hypothetical protein